MLQVHAVPYCYVSYRCGEVLASAAVLTLWYAEKKRKDYTFCSNLTRSLVTYRAA